MSGLSQKQRNSTVRWMLLLCVILASCTQSADTDSERPTTTGATPTSPATALAGEVPPETLAVDSLSFSVLGLPDEVTSYERLSIGVASTIPECRFELDAPELLWIETDDQINFEFNAPIVYQPSEEFSIGIRSIANSDCPSQTETINLKVNQGPLKYDDITLMNTSAISTDHYRVADFGFGGIEITETYTATICYPTPDDCVTHENELLGSDAHNMATGDFNNDGFEDVVVAWALFPHTLIDAPIHIYLNDGNGHLYEDTSIFLDGVPPTHPFAYRLVVGDLNGDGIDDVFAGSMGIGVQFEDPTKDYITPYPHLLLLSDEDGRFSDASGNVDDENQGRGLKCAFAHDASGGDFDGDGDIDIYACNMLLVNDGSGSFTIHPFINLEWQQWHQNPMSSLVVDLNNDGYDDLVFWNFDSQPQPEEGLILLSDGTADVAAWQRLELPVGPHGLDHNKYNHAAGGDLNNDGFTDVVVSITRDDPYYEGAYVQVLINDGTGALEDQTSTRFPSQARADKHHGEGNIYLRDLEGDGDLDIFHSTNPSVSFSGDSVSVLSGAHIAVNDGNGFFSSVEDDKLPKMPLDWESDTEMLLSKGLPVDIDGRGCLDLVSTSQTWYDWFDDRPTRARNYLFAIINIGCEGL